MTIKNTIFCILISGLFCNSNLLGSSLDPNADDKGTVDAVLIAFKGIAVAGDGYDGTWDSLPKENIIESLNSNHYSDLINRLSSEDFLNKFKSNDPDLLSNENITKTCLLLYCQVKNDTIVDREGQELEKGPKQDIMERLAYLNVERANQLLQDNELLAYEKFTLTDKNTSLKKKNETLKQQNKTLNTTNFRWKMSSLVLLTFLVAYLFFKSR